MAAFEIFAIHVRGSVLRAVGWALVVNDEPVAPADTIILTIDSDGAAALEAADLVQSADSWRSRPLKRGDVARRNGMMPPTKTR